MEGGNGGRILEFYEVVLPAFPVTRFLSRMFTMVPLCF